MYNTEKVLEREINLGNIKYLSKFYAVRLNQLIFLMVINKDIFIVIASKRLNLY